MHNLDLSNMDLDDLDLEVLPRESLSGPLVAAGAKIKLRSHNRAFLGCFSLRSRHQINWTLFKAWKADPKAHPAVTETIAEEMAAHAQNVYDAITTAPPSRYRDPKNYAAFELGRRVSAKTGLPFRIAFRQRDKAGHGRFKSTIQGAPAFRDDWDIEDASLLWIDDFINTGTTANICFALLTARGNHVDGLVWCSGSGK